MKTPMLGSATVARRRHPHGPSQGFRRRLRALGSATIEFIVMIPFVLATAGFIWDLRHYIAQRTDLAREMFVVAEMIANELDSDPIEAAVDRAKEALVGRGQRAVSVAVVVRGDRRDATATNPDPACADDDVWCLPRLTYRWPQAADAADAVWGDAGDCTTFPMRNATSTPLVLPAVDEHFSVTTRVLPHAAGTDHTAWPSRSMRELEWWVVVDTCLHSDPGLFGGVVMHGLEFFDVSESAYVMNRRAVWGSPHDLSECQWCPN
ncbi:MAG: hypothetical protein OXQ90_10535 [Gammaproteobacteria bacterium]|nr:hypothetical protein [Gammaproteobacteria bacterium]